MYMSMVNNLAVQCLYSFNLQKKMQLKLKMENGVKPPTDVERPYQEKVCEEVVTHDYNAVLRLFIDILGKGLVFPHQAEYNNLQTIQLTVVDGGSNATKHFYHLKTQNVRKSVNAL